MSLLPAFVSARLRKDDSAPPAETAVDSHDARTSATPDSHAADLDENVFNLLPPDNENEAVPPPPPQGSNKHPVDMTDLSRLSIDRDGKLYWDGKPVETHHRLSMSRRQIVGASFVALLLAVGAIGAALQGTAAARDWACRLGWTSTTCALPGGTPRSASDIPA